VQNFRLHKKSTSASSSGARPEKAAIGVLLSMQPPTKPMREEAGDAGSYDGPWGQHYPHLQLLTVGDVLDGRKIDMPGTASMAANVTHKRAPKAPGQGRFSRYNVSAHIAAFSVLSGSRSTRASRS